MIPSSDVSGTTLSDISWEESKKNTEGSITKLMKQVSVTDVDSLDDKGYNDYV